MGLGSISNMNNMYQAQGTSPWMQNTNLATFAQGYTSNNLNFGGVAGFGTSSSSSSTDTFSTEMKPGETYQAYQERMEKLKKKKAEKRQEIKNTQASLKEGIKAQEEQINATDETKVSGAKLGTKISTAAMGIFSGVTNVLKSFAGFDKDGKWQPLKCLRNLAIAVGVGALCVFAAPLGAAAAAALGGGAIATGVGTAIAATPAVLGVTGLGTGLFMVGKGTVKATKAETMEEFSQAFQDVGAGVFIAGASAAGLRSLSKGVAATASTNTSITGKIAGFCKDVTVNPFKATTNNFNIASRVMSAHGGGVQGFKAACAEVRVRPAKEAERKFNQEKQDILNRLNNEINELNAKINDTSTSAVDKSLMQAKLDRLSKTANDLSNAKTQTDWKTLSKSSKDASKSLKNKIKAFRRNGEVEINGYKFETANKQAFKAYIKSLKSTNKSLAGEINKLTEARFNTMFKMSKNQKFDKQVKDFGWSGYSWKSHVNPYNFFQAKVAAKATGMSTGSKVFAGSMFGLTLMDPVFLLQPLTNTQWGLSTSILYPYQPYYNPTAEAQPSEEVQTLIAQKEQLEEALEQSKKEYSKYC